MQKLPLKDPLCLGGEIGRRSGFKIRRWKQRVGSSPTLGTNLSTRLCNRIRATLQLANTAYVSDSIGFSTSST